MLCLCMEFGPLIYTRFLEKVVAATAQEVFCCRAGEAHETWATCKKAEEITAEYTFCSFGHGDRQTYQDRRDIIWIVLRSSRTSRDLHLITTALLAMVSLGQNHSRPSSLPPNNRRRTTAAGCARRVRGHVYTDWETASSPRQDS